MIAGEGGLSPEVHSMIATGSNMWTIKTPEDSGRSGLLARVNLSIG